MNFPNESRRLLKLLVVAGFIPAITWGAEAYFGQVGITSIETARLAVFCPADPTRTTTSEPCEVALHFHDTRGRIVKETSLTLNPDRGGFLDIRSAETGSTVSRVEIIPCFRVGRGAVVSSIQVFDNFTLRTRIMTSWGDRPLARTGEMHVGLVGITAFDTARVTAFCPADLTLPSAPSPCDVTLLFHEIGGRVVKLTDITLQPGTGGSLDLRSTELGSAIRRGEIVPCVRVARGAVVSTVEVIDNLTGLTTGLTNPGALLAAAPAQ